MKACEIQPGATWADAWAWGSCNYGQVQLANCRLDRAGGRPLAPDCKALLLDNPFDLNTHAQLPVLAAIPP